MKYTSRFKIKVKSLKVLKKTNDKIIVNNTHTYWLLWTGILEWIGAFLAALEDGGRSGRCRIVDSLQGDAGNPILGNLLPDEIEGRVDARSWSLHGTGPLIWTVQGVLDDRGAHTKLPAQPLHVRSVPSNNQSHVLFVDQELVATCRGNSSLGMGRTRPLATVARVHAVQT